MQMVPEPSLLDDARFLEELAKVEALPREDKSIFPKPVPTMAEPAQPVAIADELPPALGPRRNGPQFVLAPPPSRRKSPHRRSSRAVLALRTSERREQPADVTDSVSTTAAASAESPDDQERAAEVVREAARNPKAEGSLNAFPCESARSIAGQTSERERVSGAGRSAPLHPALAVLGFVLMMSIGAGVAALVFHDRVTQIVALLEKPTARR
jgi:hypothetical protein